MTVSPTESDIETEVRSFLLAILPAGIEVVQGQGNRVAEPPGSDYVVATATFRERIETNIDAYLDCRFTGTIVGGVLGIASIDFGTIDIGATVFGTTVGGTGLGTATIVSQISGSVGGVGSYAVAGSQAAALGLMACGQAEILQPVKVTLQLDVHGPSSADNAQVISTLFRDSYGVDFFTRRGMFFDGTAPAFDIVPLYADDPKQVPFLNAEQQYETRWIVEALVQANQIVSVAQQFADSAVVGVIEVDTTYPP